ncbi:hypothetical protein QOT17_023181 [Balamuthia mandrillaris]
MRAEIEETEWCLLCSLETLQPKVTLRHNVTTTSSASSVRSKKRKQSQPSSPSPSRRPSPSSQTSSPSTSTPTSPLRSPSPATISSSTGSSRSPSSSSSSSSSSSTSRPPPPLLSFSPTATTTAISTTTTTPATFRCTLCKQTKNSSEETFRSARLSLCQLCHRCSGCNRPQESYIREGEDDIFCETCHKELFVPKCVVCGRFVSGMYITYPDINESRCSTHNDEEVCLCLGCKRPLGALRPFHTYPDGRKICQTCKATAVTEDRIALECFNEVGRWFAAQVGDSALEGRAVFLVYRDEMEVLAAAEEEQHSCTVGVTITSTTSRDQQQQRRPPLKERQVHSVAILAGLPRGKTYAVIAHEFMHVWMSLRPDFAFLELSAEIREGLAELCAWLVIQAMIKAGDLPNEEAEHALAAIGTQKGEWGRPYREGFRQAKKRYEQHGLAHLLDFIAEHHRWPPLSPP